MAHLRSAAAAEDELFGGYELTPQQYNALRLLRGQHPETLPTLALAERLVSHAPDITRLLDKLEERGLITRAAQARESAGRPGRPDRSRIGALGTIGSAGAGVSCSPARALDAGAVASLIELLEAARQPHEPPKGSWAQAPCEAPAER